MFASRRTDINWWLFLKLKLVVASKSLPMRALGLSCGKQNSKLPPVRKGETWSSTTDKGGLHTHGPSGAAHTGGVHLQVVVELVFKLYRCFLTVEEG